MMKGDIHEKNQANIRRNQKDAGATPTWKSGNMVLLQNGGYMRIHTPELFFVWQNVAFKD